MPGPSDPRSDHPKRHTPRAPAARGSRPPPSASGAPSRRTKRREERVTINKEFESFDAFVSEYVSNISRSGVFVRTRKPLKIGTKVNLRFTVLMDEVETVEGLGEVVRVHDDPPGMGVVFTELSSFSKALIERMLTAQRLRPAAERKA